MGEEGEREACAGQCIWVLDTVRHRTRQEGRSVYQEYHNTPSVGKKKRASESTVVIVHAVVRLAMCLAILLYI